MVNAGDTKPYASPGLKGTTVFFSTNSFFEALYSRKNFPKSSKLSTKYLTTCLVKAADGGGPETEAAGVRGRRIHFKDKDID